MSEIVYVVELWINSDYHWSTAYICASEEIAEARRRFLIDKTFQSDDDVRVVPWQLETTVEDPI